MPAKKHRSERKASHATPGASYAPTDCSALSDSEKVAVFEKHLRDLPWGYAHQEYGVPQEKPTLFARMFLWPRLWNWLRIHNKTEVEIDLLVRIAREMGYDFQEPNMWSGITAQWDVSGKLIRTGRENENPFVHIMTLAECMDAEKPNSELESPPWLVPVETVVAAIEDYDPRSVKMSLADYVVVRCHSNQPNPTGLRCAGLGAHKQDPVVGQPELTKNGQ